VVALAEQHFARLPDERACSVVQQHEPMCLVLHEDRIGHGVEQRREHLAGGACVLLGLLEDRDVLHDAAVPGEDAVGIEHGFTRHAQEMDPVVVRRAFQHQIAERLMRLERRTVCRPAAVGWCDTAKLPGVKPRLDDRIAAAGGVEQRVGRDEPQLGVLLPVPVGRQRRETAEAHLVLQRGPLGRLLRGDVDDHHVEADDRPGVVDVGDELAGEPVDRARSIGLGALEARHLPGHDRRDVGPDDRVDGFSDDVAHLLPDDPAGRHAQPPAVRLVDVAVGLARVDVGQHHRQAVVDEADPSLALRERGLGASAFIDLRPQALVEPLKLVGA
jgi:hypothetical protein